MSSSSAVLQFAMYWLIRTVLLLCSCNVVSLSNKRGIMELSDYRCLHTSTQNFLICAESLLSVE
eukprot:scaffold31310_cov27-Prasinocladus_malaysianus.AAC.1